MALSIQRIRSKHKLNPFELEFSRGLVNRGMDALVDAAFPELLPTELPEQRKERHAAIRAEYEADYLEHVTDNTKLYDGIAPALKEIAGFARLVLYTNKPEKISRELLSRLGILNYFSFLIGGDSFAESKPSEIPMKAAQSSIDMLGTKSVMTGDTLADIQAARNFGAASIWCSWGYLKDVPSEKPDRIVSHPGELVKAILEFC